MIMPALDETPEDGKPNGERIAKVIARSGLCSRRDAEVLIGEKRVSVNGAVIESAALDVSPEDKVLVDGKPLASRQPPRLWRYHKPKGRVTTHKDPEGRPTVFEALPEDLPRLISVGRLDFNTEGLLLLTNDGDLARHLELPSTGWARRYRVRAFGQIEQSKLDELAGGLRTGGVNYGPIEATLEREQGDNVWITLLIREGKNREVRRIMEHLGLTVNRLIRISFGPFILGDLEPGQIEEVKTSVLKDQLGPRLTRQLGVRREVMREERKLPPTRSKPTYLRRKPSAPERPERPAEETRLKRRRVLPMDGSEAPRVELVPEKKRGPDRFAKGGSAPEKPYRRSREERPEREDRDRPASREGGQGWSKAPDRESRERAPRPEGERRWSKEPDRGARAGGDRPPRREEGRGGSERPSFAARKTGQETGERPRWKSRPEQGAERPRSRFRAGEGGDRPVRQIAALSAAARTHEGPARIGLLTKNAEKTRATAAPKSRSLSGSPSGGIETVIQQAAPRGATVKAANDAPLGAMLRENARSVPRGVRIEKTRVRARPGNRGHSRSAALMGRGAKHRRAVTAANGAAPGAMLRENGRSAPRGVRIEKTRVRARPGNRGHSGSAALMGRGAKHRHAVKAANGAAPGAMLRENGRSVPRGVRIEKTRVRAGPGNQGHSGNPALKVRGAKHRHAVKAANGAPLVAMLRENGRSVPRGVRIEKTRVRAGPGNQGHSGSPASKVQGAKHRGAEKAANP